jgi:hypothetical protein
MSGKQMTDMTSSQAADPTLSAPLRGVLPALLLFSGVLLGLLLLSLFLVLPRYTTLQLGGAVLSASTVPEYARRLEAEIEAEEAKRDALTLPLRDPLYVALRERSTTLSLADLEHLLDAMLAASSYGDAVHIDALVVEGDKAEMAGDVHGVGPRSLTVLAQFVDDLASQSFVGSLTPPSFVREDDPMVGIRSPFVIRMTLASDR